MTYHVGCSGWYYNDWAELIYPKDLPKNQWLSYYVTLFNTVELNFSFYHWPTESHLKKLKDTTPDNFKFAIKVNRQITHYKQFKDCKSLCNDFYNLAANLGNKLACVLFQLPPRFIYSEERLNRILESIDSKQMNVIEFRHASWWQPEIIQQLHSQKIVVCSVNSPKLTSELFVNLNTLYLRFHGTKPFYHGKYPAQTLKKYAKQINEISKHAWIYFNNDFEGHAVTNAKQMIDYLK